MERSEALDIVRKNWPKDIHYTEALRTLIPELKESEDEKTRRELLDFIKDAKQSLELQERDNNKWQIEQLEIYIAWLEKQGEQKPTEPSVKDKEMVHYISNAISEPDASAYLEEKNIKVIDAHVWLENLLFEDKTRFQSQWKPTKQQMEAIKQAAEQNRASEMGNILDNLFVELKNRCTWKPSEGQLECLMYAIDNAKKDYKPLTTNRIYLTLQALYYDLKALCEK